MGGRRAIADHCDAIGVFHYLPFAEAKLCPPPPRKFDGTRCACKTARRREELIEVSKARPGRISGGGLTSYDQGDGRVRLHYELHNTNDGGDGDNNNMVSTHLGMHADDLHDMQ